MNKIFKVIYSKTRHCYVVVSELAKSHCKTTQSHTVRSKTALTAAVLLALGTFSVASVFMPITAEAADKTRTDGSNFVGVERTNGLLDESKYENSGGKGANGADSITIGLKAQAGAGTITIGDRNAGASLGSVYVGQGDIAKPKLDTGGWATSIGYNSDATGYGSIALGSNAVAKNSYAQDSKGESLVYQQTVVENGEQKVRLVAKPDIQRASVAIGYGASADNGNIAIGSYSDASTDLRTAKTPDGEEIKSYLTDKKADSYVSVGKTGALRRISNVADGAADSDAATIAQLKKAVEETDASKKANIDASNIGENLKKADGKTAADSSDKKNNKDAWGNAIGTGKVEKNNGQLVTGGTVYSALENQKKDLSVHAGWGISVAKDKDGNAISLNRNLGRDAYTKDKAVLKADENKSALVIGGRVNPGDATGGQTAEKDYGALGQDSVTVGGADNTVRENGDAAVVVGGVSNTASAQYSTVIGGSANDALGNQSSVFGGHDNDAHGTYSTASGGSMNRAYGAAASVFGGGVNSALGDSSVAVGGLQSTVNGTFAVGIAGGSTNADYALAAGNGANVTVENGTAIGYQATTDEAGTIAFGHDAGDAYYSSTTWPQKATKQNGKYYDANNKEISKAKYDALKNSDGTWNDYSKTPTVVEKTYDKAAYNRLVKVADGKDDHDVVVMEQLTKATNDLTKDLSVNAGWGINIADEKDPKTGEVTKKNTISLNRNLGTNYGNLGWGEGKVTFEASGQNSLILGGAASVSEYDHHSDVKAGVYGKDSVLVGGFNNLIGEKGETSVIVGGQENQVTNQKSVIVGGFWNKVTGSNSVVVGGVSKEASGSGDGVFGGFRNKVSGGESVVLGGQTNEVIGTNSVVSGGTDNKVSGNYASANGGKQNTISGDYAATLGGFNNQSKGMFSNAIGGDNNITSGQYSITSGGSGNTASGDNSYIGGGSNQAAGVGASVFGGYRSKVNGILSTGVGGGSTNNRATAALAAGYQSMVTDGGVAYRSLTSEERSKIYKGQQYWPGFSGFLVDNDTKVLDRISTAIGYQATADAPGVISFGHDKGDESSENGRYSSAYYNRLVKAADGIEDHDAVVMEQLKNASDVGSKIKVYQTDENGNIKFDKNNNPIEDTSDSDDVKTRREAAQKASEDAWGKAIGTGKIADPTKSDTNDPEANGSQQLVTGGTVYTEVRPATDGTYVKTKNTTAANLTALDKQVAANTTKLGDKNHNIKYYSVEDKISDDKLLPSISGYSNEKNDGAKGAGSMAAGFNTHADGIASTVAGSYSGVVGTGLQGAAALSYGTFNVNQNAAQAGTFSGVANSIVGQANVTTDSNAAIIYGAGNTVKNSYRDIDTKNASEIKAAARSGDVTKLGEALQKAVPTSGGQVMVMGGGNNVESAYMTQVVGVGNTVKGNQVKDDKNEWVTDTSSETAIKDYDPEKSSQYNYVDGFNNEVINGKHDYIIGANNKLDGDSYDDNNAKPIKRSNKSNVVIGDNHALTGKKNNVIIGSADTEGTLTRASDAVIIGHKANATSDTGADNAVAIGLSATAGGGNAVTIGVNTSAGENSITIGSESSAISGQNIAIGRYAKVDGYEVTKAVALGQKAEAQVTDGVAIGSGSIATVKGNSVEGYDPTTGQDSTDGTATWKATNAAVSIGTADGKVTRQINGVAAGTNDTDAVNVAQIKKLASINASNIGANLQYGADGTTAATDTDKTKNKEAWATAIGTGTVTKDDDGSKQMVTGKTVYDALHGGLDNITVGKDGKDGKDGSIGIAGQNGKDGYTMTYIKTEQGAAGVDGKDGITRVVYQDKDGNGKHTFATLDDGLKFKGDDSTVIARKLNEQLNITGGADSTKLTDKNIGVNSSTDGLKIQLAKDLTSITSISGSTDTNGAKITLDENDKNISVNGGSIKDVASNLTKDGKIIKGSANNAASISDVQTLVQQGVDNGYTNGNGITIQKDGTSGKNVISVNQGDGLKFDSGKLAVNTGDGLTVDETTKALKIKTSDSNLKVDSNGIGLSDKITIGSDKTKQVTIDGTKGEISGLTNTTWDSKADYSKSTKAATESQVDAAVKDAVKQAGDNDVDTHVKAGSYGVDANHQVSMDIVDKNGKATGKKVTITDVATHTEVGDVTKLDKGVQNASGTTSVVDAINNLNTSMNTKIGDQNYSKSNTSGTNKYVSDGDSITSAIGKLDGAVQQAASAAGKHSTVSEGSNIKVNGNVQNDGHTDYKVSLKDDISLNSVTTDTLTVNNSATIGGVTIANKTISGLDDTKIEKGSTNAVNANTIYNELRPATDGNYIKISNTTAQNITNLDTQVKKNSDLVNSDGSTIKIGSKDSATKVDISDKNGSGRVVTGVVTDTNDASSAANVGYVNNMAAANTQQIYRDMNNAYSRLDTNINRAAAGSNALAALHPLDFDPADKASFAVGYGHYRNANAAAVGAFYQPNANTMVNMGISLGNGDPGFNAGVSFKIGKGSAYNGVSKAEMAQTIHDQATEISAIKADDAAKDKRIDALEKENQEMKKQIQEILARLNG